MSMPIAHAKQHLPLNVILLNASAGQHMCTKGATPSELS